MREVKVEEYLRLKMEGLGGLCEKHVSPKRKGVPDRLVTFPDGYMTVVELKTIDGELEPSQLSPSQVRDHKQRARCKVIVPVLWTTQQIASWLIDNLKHWYRPGLRDFTVSLRKHAGLDVA